MCGAMCFVAPVCFNTTYCGGESLSDDLVTLDQCCFELSGVSFITSGQCLPCPTKGNLIVKRYLRMYILIIVECYCIMYIYVCTYMCTHGHMYISTVQFNYNFIFTRMYTRGTTRKLHCIPVTCFRGPRFLVACNMHVSCNLSWKHAWNNLLYTRRTKLTRGTEHACTHTCNCLTHGISSTAT